MTQPPDFTPATIYVRTQAFEALPESLRLRCLEWSLLLAVSGRHTVAQLGATFGVAAAARDAAFTTLVGQGLITERPLTRPEFLAAQATVTADEPQTLAAFLSPQEPALPDVGFAPLDLQLEDEPMAAVIPHPARRRLSLKALMECLVAGAPTTEEGQMNVYRTFIRVDSQLLQRNGIRTLRFEEERWVEDPVLQAQILTSAATTLGAPVPEFVFG